MATMLTTQLAIVAPHPLATIRLQLSVSAERRLGLAGAGFRIAMQTFDVFRASVAALLLGLPVGRLTRR